MSQSLLPEEFQFSHDFCFFLHDQLVEILKSGEEANIFSHHWEIEKGETPPPEGLSGEEFFDWLEDNGHKDIVFTLYYKQICAALLSDMLHFIYEALSCSAKGKLTVAYALLRKPLKENLFCLEWLLADPVNMLAVFDGDDLRARSINKAFSDTQKKELIRKAVGETEHGEWMDAEFLYDLRYNKKFSSGFEQLFQKANHLVTSFRFLETERSNFNFVFSDKDSWQSQWEGLYSFLPMLMFHTVQIVEALIATFATRKEGIDLTSIRTAIGMAFWIEKGPHAAKSDQIRADIRSAFEKAQLTCPQCSNLLTYPDSQLLALYRKNEMSCSECSWSVDLGRLTSDL